MLCNNCFFLSFCFKCYCGLSDHCLITPFNLTLILLEKKRRKRQKIKERDRQHKTTIKERKKRVISVFLQEIVEKRDFLSLSLLRQLCHHTKDTISELRRETTNFLNLPIYPISSSSSSSKEKPVCRQGVITSLIISYFFRRKIESHNVFHSLNITTTVLWGHFLVLFSCPPSCVITHHNRRSSKTRARQVTVSRRRRDISGTF